MQNRTVSVAKMSLIIGAFLMALAVAMGAIGSHALPESATEKMLHRFDLAVTYHSYHALGLMILGVAGLGYPSRWFASATIMMFCGLGIFCGGLYGLVLTDSAWLSRIIPMGGMMMISSWLVGAWGAYKAIRLTPSNRKE